MKKLILSIATACVVLTFTPNEVKATPDSPKTEKSAAESAQAQKLINRLEEIKAMDKSTLSRDEKKELRKEVRSTERSLSEIGGGVYISVGAAILIIILLIILL